MGLSALNTVAVSAISILTIRCLHVHQSLKQGGRSRGLSLQRHLFQRGLVAGQLALSLMLLIGAALLVQSFSRLLDNELGFEPDHLLTFQVSPPASRYSKASSLEYYRRLTESLDALPAIVIADVTSGPPFCHATFRFTSRIFTRQSQVFSPDELLSIEFSHVGPHYFKTMDASIIEGRSFTPADSEEAAPVAILNEAAARAFWPDDGAVGKTVFWGQPFRVVGVVRNMRNVRRDLQARPAFYLSVNQQVWSTMTVVVRYHGSLEALIPLIRRETRALDPELPMFNVRTMADMVSGASAQARFSTWLLGAFAVSALSLALVGLYGVTSCLVTERTHEYGIRLALGALPHDVLYLILRQNAPVWAIGLFIGTGVSLTGTRLLAGLLYEIRPTDVTTFAGAALFLTAVTLVACWIPARRAAKVDPLEALRYE
jgi:putative ABC transport system permease protein